MEQRVFSAASTATEQPHTAHPCDGEGPGKVVKKLSAPHTPDGNPQPSEHPSRGRKTKVKNLLSIASWNVLTENYVLAETPDRPHCRTALVTLELARYNIDIAALSETRLHGEDSLTEAGAGYTFFWKGVPEGSCLNHGVGFAVKSKLLQRIPNPLSASMRD